jgi:hypothetical protein
MNLSQLRTKGSAGARSVVPAGPVLAVRERGMRIAHNEGR